MSNIEWLRERQKGIGGSDVGAILGCSPYKTIVDVYNEKVTPIPDDYEQKDNIFMERGRALEPIIGQKYAEVTGRKILRSPENISMKDFPFMKANIDYHIVPKGILEIKCPGLSVFGRMEREGIPPYYYAQLQHYMLVTGWKWGSFAIFNAEKWKLLHFDIDADAEFQELILSKCREFWDCVKNREVPELDEDLDVSDQCPDIGGKDIYKPEDSDWLESMESYRSAMELQSTANELVSLAKADMKARMEGKHEIAEGGGMRFYCRTTKGRRSFNYKQMLMDRPDDGLDKYFKEGKPSITLKAYRIKENNNG